MERENERVGLPMGVGCGDIEEECALGREGVGDVPGNGGLGGQHDL